MSDFETTVFTRPLGTLEFLVLENDRFLFRDTKVNLPVMKANSGAKKFFEFVDKAMHYSTCNAFINLPNVVVRFDKDASDFSFSWRFPEVRLDISATAMETLLNEYTGWSLGEAHVELDAESTLSQPGMVRLNEHLSVEYRNLHWLCFTFVGRPGEVEFHNFRGAEIDSLVRAYDTGMPEGYTTSVRDGDCMFAWEKLEPKNSLIPENMHFRIVRGSKTMSSMPKPTASVAPSDSARSTYRCLSSTPLSFRRSPRRA